MTAYSHSLWVDASHRACVVKDFPAWQFAGMDSRDKNGGPNNLRAWRVDRGLSQEQLAAKVVRGLSLKWLRRLADALDTTPGHLTDHLPEQAEVLDFWSKRLDRDELRQLSRIAEALKTGTGDK
jgi:hypothetical protein